jgi:hypothetical protein
VLHRDQLRGLRRWQRLLVEAVLEDRLDVSVRAGAHGTCPVAGCLQPGLAILFAKSEPALFTRRSDELKRNKLERGGEKRRGEGKARPARGRELSETGLECCGGKVVGAWVRQPWRSS